MHPRRTRNMARKHGMHHTIPSLSSQSTASRRRARCPSVITSLQIERKVISLKPKASIELFLRLAKQFTKDRGVILVQRKEGRAFLETNGLSTKDVNEMILQLSVSDCFDGPEADRDKSLADSWTVAEFNPVWRTSRLYLKISINLSAKRCKRLSIKPYRDTWEIHDGTKDL